MKYSSYQGLSLRRERGVAFVMINYPPMNLLDVPLVKELSSFLDEAQSDDAVRVIFLRQKTPPFRAGDAWRSGSPCGRLYAVPQGLREVTLVERGRYPRPQCSCQPVTAFHLRVSMSGPL